MSDGEEAGGPSIVRRVGLVAGPVVCALVVAIPSPLHRLEGLGHRPAFAAGVSLLMAIWWFTEALPIHWTSLIPLVAWPALDVFGAGVVGSAGRAAGEFVNAYIFLFAGGMAIGAAMEHWNLHRRVALHIMLRIGASPRRLLLGMLVSTSVISLWISNTATAVMMMPIGLAVVSQLELRAGRKLGSYAAALMLAVAYAANVGGIGTKIGSATNSIFVGFLSAKLQYDMSFLEYVAVALPFVILFVPIIWLVLWKLSARDAPRDATGREILRAELDALGSMTIREKQVAQAFLLAATLWILGDPIRALLKPLSPFPFEGRHYEAWVALLGAGLLVARGALPLAAVKRIPVPALLLLGGSFAMAAGIEGSGLSRWLGLQLEPVRALPLLAQLFIAVAATVALSAVASNTATVNLMLALLPANLPLLSAVGMAASCDFALPAGTPPNAIVFGSGRIRLPTMMRVGVLLDLAAVLLLTLYGATWLRLVLG
ncbi:MAG: DASS family sodium-coupled anion symporter [Myxococcota bacterium]